MFTAERMTVRRGRAVVASNSLVKSVLVVDIGGTSVKILASGHQASDALMWRSRILQRFITIWMESDQDTVPLPEDDEGEARGPIDSNVAEKV